MLQIFVRIDRRIQFLADQFLLRALRCFDETLNPVDVRQAPSSAEPPDVPALPHVLSEAK